MKTADLVDDFDDEVSLCHLPFLRFGRRASFSGPVQTVKCFEDNVLLRAELESPGRGRVLAVDAGGSTRIAVMGDKLAGFAIQNGWAGVVLNGAIRDSAEIDAMEIGLRALAASPKKSAKAGAGQVGAPIHMGGVSISPGDWIYADEDGVLVAGRKLI